MRKSASVTLTLLATAAAMSAQSQQAPAPVPVQQGCKTAGLPTNGSGVPTNCGTSRGGFGSHGASHSAGE